MLHQIFRWAYRKYWGVPNSRLQTLLDNKGDACYKIALNYLNQPSCTIQYRHFSIRFSYDDAAKACFNCPLERSYEGHRLNQLIKELENVTYK